MEQRKKKIREQFGFRERERDKRTCMYGSGNDYT
jgi:hypothetical protein